MTWINWILTKINSLPIDRRTLITGFAGALLGAFVVYFFDLFKQWRKTRHDNYTAIISTQLALAGQLNSLDLLWQEHLEPMRDTPERHMHLIHFQFYFCDLRVAYENLAFLLKKKHANLVLEILVAEQSYLTAKQFLELRNQAYDKLHANSVLEQFDKKTGRAAILPRDPRDVRLLEKSTDSLFSAVVIAQGHLSRQFEELKRVGKSLYRWKKFLNFAEARQSGKPAVPIASALANVGL